MVPSTIFLVFCMTRPGIEPCVLGPWANTLPIRLLAQYMKNWRHCSREDLNMAKKRKSLVRNCFFFLISAQNNPRTTSYILTKTDYTQQNGKCRLSKDGDKKINYMINECSKLVQIEYKSKHDWIWKVNFWEWCKRIKFDPANKTYMHK